jgi:hypothetical protein
MPQQYVCIISVCDNDGCSESDLRLISLNLLRLCWMLLWVFMIFKWFLHSGATEVGSSHGMSPELASHQ